MLDEVTDELCLCIEPGCCHLHLYKYVEDKNTEYWWYAITSHGLPFWNRIKIAWKVLTKGVGWFDEAMLGTKEATKIKNWLTHHLDHIKEDEKHA